MLIHLLVPVYRVFSIFLFLNYTIIYFQFFNNALFLGQTSESELSQSFCEVIYELHKISSSVLLSVIPQLEYKVKVGSHNWLILLCVLLNSLR